MIVQKTAYSKFTFHLQHKYKLRTIPNRQYYQTQMNYLHEYIFKKICITNLWLSGTKCPWTMTLHLSVKQLVSIFLCPCCQDWGCCSLLISGRPLVFSDSRDQLTEAAPQTGWAQINCDCDLVRITETSEASTWWLMQAEKTGKKQSAPGKISSVGNQSLDLLKKGDNELLLRANEQEVSLTVSNKLLSPKCRDLQPLISKELF